MTDLFSTSRTPRYEKSSRTFLIQKFQVQASPNANTFAISGNAQVKQISEMLPSIVSQMGPEGFASLRKMAMQGAEAEAAKKDDVPELEGDFEEESKKEDEEDAQERS